MGGKETFSASLMTLSTFADEAGEIIWPFGDIIIVMSRRRNVFLPWEGGVGDDKSSIL